MTTNIKDYSTTQASNTTLNSIDVNEGMLPSNLNNAIRALMKILEIGLTIANGLSMVMVMQVTQQHTHQAHLLQLMV